jgi:hypothetical protein
MPTKKRMLKRKMSIRRKHRTLRRTHKKRNTLVKRRRYHKKMSGSGDVMDKLTNGEIEEILDNFGMNEDKRNEARELLIALKFDPNYTQDCFFSTLPKNPDDKLTLNEQAISKVQCWLRYGDPLK